MAPDDVLDDADAADPEAAGGGLRVLDSGDAGRAGLPWAWILGLVVLVGGSGAAVWFLREGGLGVAVQQASAPPAADNLLGAAWSFETTDGESPERAWGVPEDAPTGFAFGAAGAVSGEAGAVAAPEDGEWARIAATDSHRLGAARPVVSLQAVAGGDGVQLILRFEGEGHPAVEVVVASGTGAIAGRTPTPPGYTHVRAVIGAVSAGSVDDVVMRELDELAPAPLRRGLFDVVSLDVGLDQGLLVLRGNDLVFQVEGVAIDDGSGRRWPAAVAALPGAGELALPGGGRVQVDGTLSEDGTRIRLQRTFAGLPAEARVFHVARAVGALAAAPVGVGSSGGFETFTDDFQVEGVRTLVLGAGAERLVLGGDGVDVAATWMADGTIEFLVERVGSAKGRGSLSLQTDFQEERVQAAQLRTQAEGEERAGRLGRALATTELILREYPYDEGVLAWARGTRSRLQASMQQRLDAIEADLQDALFLASARRCREVREDCLEAAHTFAESAAEARFQEAAVQVAERARDLLEADRSRRERRVRAVRESFAEAGTYENVVEELDAFLETTLAPDP